MTPVTLLEELKCEIKDAIKGMMLPTQGAPGQQGTCREPEVHLMRMPDRKAEISKAPYILLQLINGADSQEAGETPESTCNIRVVICLYAEKADEGSLNVADVIMRIRDRLLRKRVIGRKFTMQLPLEYLLYQDDTAPLFMGELMTVWELPSMKREVKL